MRFFRKIDFPELGLDRRRPIGSPRLNKIFLHRTPSHGERGIPSRVYPFCGYRAHQSIGASPVQSDAEARGIPTAPWAPVAKLSIGSSISVLVFWLSTARASIFHIEIGTNALKSNFEGSPGLKPALHSFYSSLIVNHSTHFRNRNLTEQVKL